MSSSSLPYLIIVMSGWPIEDRQYDFGETRSEEALSGAMQQPGTIVAIYSLFSKSDGNGHFRRYAAS
jgi:hypothetical protein